MPTDPTLLATYSTRPDLSGVDLLTTIGAPRTVIPPALSPLVSPTAMKPMDYEGKWVVEGLAPPREIHWWPFATQGSHQGIALYLGADEWVAARWGLVVFGIPPIVTLTR